MKLNNKLTIINEETTQELTIFQLIKNHMDSIKTERDFIDFKKQVNMSFTGCIEYVNAVSFSDKNLLVHRYQSKE